MRWLIRRPLIAFVAPMLALPLASLSSAQATSQVTSLLGWSGWVRCDVSVQGRGYTDQQTHTWLMSGAPTVQGAFYVYPGTWSAVGGGGLQNSQGTQSLTAQWATNASAVSAPIAVFVRASDKQMLIQSRHTQLRARGAIQGYQRQSIDGKAQRPAPISLEAFEWAFPLISVPPRTNTVSGSKSQPTTGSVGPMQPAGSQGTASCSWQFGQGAAAPALPPAVIARTVPAPGGAGGAGGAAPEGAAGAAGGGGGGAAGGAPPADVVNSSAAGAASGKGSDPGAGAGAAPDSTAGSATSPTAGGAANASTQPSGGARPASTPP